MRESDFSDPFIIGYGSSPPRCGPATAVAVPQRSDDDHGDQRREEYDDDVFEALVERQEPESSLVSINSCFLSLMLRDGTLLSLVNARGSSICENVLTSLALLRAAPRDLDRRRKPRGPSFQ
jgi:hypothetical protein